MLGFMETEKEFIKIGRNTGARPAACGISPTGSFWDYRYSPDADGNQSGYMVYGADGSAGGRSCHFFGLGFWLCILPSLLIGLGTWDKKNRKYKYLLRGNMRYMPFKERPWKRGEKWQLYGIGSLMTAFSVFIILHLLH